MSTNDIAGVKACLDGYNDALNHRDWDKVPTFYSDDCEWYTTNFRNFSFTGSKAIGEGLKGIVDDMDMLVQIPITVMIELTGPNTAKARATCEECAIVGDISFRTFVALNDELRREGDVWKITKRAVTYRYWEDGALKGNGFKASYTQDWRKFND